MRMGSGPVAADQGRAEPDGADIDLMALVGTLWRGRLWISIAVLLAIFIGGYYAWRVAVPVYRATAVVMMESREASFAGLDTVLGGLSSGETSVINTEVEVLRGRILIGRVVDELNLTTDPEFNSTLRELGKVARLKLWITSPFRSTSKADPALEDARRNAEREGAISALLGRLSIRNAPSSLVFQITAESTSPAKAARIADTLSRLYIDDQLRVKFEATEVATSWLTGQVSRLKKDLEHAESEVRRFRSETGLVDGQVLVARDQQLKETRERIALAEAQESNLSERLRQISEAPDAATRAALIGDAQLLRMAGEGLEADVAFINQLDSIIARMEQDRARLATQVRALRSAETVLAADNDRQSQELIVLDQMVREADSSRLLYEHFQTRLKETSAQQGIQQADSRVLSPAVVPSVPYAPRKSVILAMSGILGLMAGIGAVLLREMRAHGIRNTAELEALTGRVVLAQIPQIPENNRSRSLAYLVEHPASAPAEAIRNLRTSILLSSIDRQPKVVAFTSSVPGEGKTTLTLAMAQNMTAMGKKVLVIEGDIRRRVFSQYFKIMQEKGLVAVMAGELSLAEAVCSVPNVGDVLIGEKTKVNAADLFASAAFAKLLADARAAYDMVLIDTAPVLVVPDARVIAQNVDTAVFAVEWDRTSPAQVTEALHQLQIVNVPVAGLVLTQVSPEGMRRYGYGDSYGAYAAYGRKYYTTD